MAGSVNKVILIGNVGKDPEIRQLQNGSKVANLSLATSETWKDKTTGEKREKTEWHRVVVFNEGLVKVIESYIRKGSKLYVEGALQTRKWTDQQGVEKYSTEIVLQAYRGEITMLGGKSEQGDSGGYQSNAQSQQSQQGQQGDQAPSFGGGFGGGFGSGAPALDDEIPFAPW